MALYSYYTERKLVSSKKKIRGIKFFTLENHEALTLSYLHASFSLQNITNRTLFIYVLYTGCFKNI